MKERKTTVSHESEESLVAEAYLLFLSANNHRNKLGITPSLQKGFVRQTMMDDDTPYSELIKLNQQDCYDCDCDHEKSESCSTCENELVDVCNSDEFKEVCRNTSIYSGMANLLTTVKKYEFIALMENAYAQVGNKPFKFKATKEPESNDEEKEQAAKQFFSFLENYLETNQVRVNEIASAFNVETLGEVSNTLEDEAQAQAKSRLDRSVEIEETVMEKVFSRANLMQVYREVIKDTVDYPIGVMWADDLTIKKQRKVVGGKLKFDMAIQCGVKRVDPCYFWMTDDHTVNKFGRAVFKLEQYTSGEIQNWIEKGVTGSEKINQNVRDYLEDNEDGYRETKAALFNDHWLLQKGLYDVMVSRGYYSKEAVKEMDVNIPKEYEHENYLPCEIRFSNGKLLTARVMKTVDETMGVYTTVFRRNGQSVFGYSLHDFVYPFARMYEGMLESMDKNMANSTSSIIQIDRGVIDNPSSLLSRDENGETELDFSEDWVVEFDSSDVFNPNFRGMPIHIDQLPSNLNKLLPLRDFIMREIEEISGIPSILVNSSNISSALRTDANFRSAFSASAKVVTALLRGSEDRILKPVIQFFFDVKAMNGEMKNFLIDAEPEILLSDTLLRENNEDQELLNGVGTILQLGSGLIPQEKVGGLINLVAREVYNLDEDLVPGVSALSTTSASTPVQPV